MGSHQESAISEYEGTLEDQKLRKLRVLNLRYTFKEERYGLLTMKKAFFRWNLIANPSFPRKFLSKMYKNCRITPSKAIWVLSSKCKPKEDEISNLHSQKRLEMGLMIIKSLMKKVLYRNTHHYFFQGRLLFLRRPLIYFLIRAFQAKTLAAFKHLRMKTTPKNLQTLRKGLRILLKLQNKLMNDAYWRIKMASIGKRKARVHFKIDSLDELSLKSSPVVGYNLARFHVMN